VSHEHGFGEKRDPKGECDGHDDDDDDEEEDEEEEGCSSSQYQHNDGSPPQPEGKAHPCVELVRGIRVRVRVRVRVRGHPVYFLRFSTPVIFRPASSSLTVLNVRFWS